ncbi:MAG: hypothetical protein LBC70_01310 [Chitinispirillales bacterium]|jgi:flagellar basal-body rod modification protein FlgD|nr:hypothetical protein [Chitinispirillales bacterium]
MLTQSIDSLLRTTAPYSVTSSILDGGLGEAQYNGDMSGDIWKPTNELGKESFLLLLLTQLQYQDPLSPMENSDFVAQLAQFRALETGENTERAIQGLNDLLNENVATQMYAAQSVANSAAMSLIGREVRMIQPTVSWDGRADTMVPIRVHLGNADTGTVQIRNSDGEVIRTLAVTGKDAENSAIVHWNGRLDNGELAKAGTYAIGLQGSEQNRALYTFVQDVVEGVRFTADGVLVKISGREISMSEVLDVSTGEEGYMSQSSALSLMGKEVRARHDSIRHSATAGAEHSIMISGPASQQMTVEIRNASGHVVSTVHGYTNESGRATLFWNGRNSNDDMAPAGDYKIHVVGSERNSGLYSFIEGTVDGLTSLTGDFKLRVGGHEIAVSDILSISTPRS